VAFLLGDADVYFTVLFFKLSCVYALFVHSLNNMCKIVIMSIFFLQLDTLILFLSFYLTTDLCGHVHTQNALLLSSAPQLSQDVASNAGLL
jgi:hypothetical protein